MSSKSAVARIYEAFNAGRWRSNMAFTYEKGYAVTSEFWHLLISSGFNFQTEDLVSLKAYCGEGHYSLAVRNGNISFAYAYENKYKRTPFIGTGLNYDRCHPGFSNHATQSKSSGRLVIGTAFHWKGELAEVTSFNDEKKSLVACAYHKRKDGYKGKIKKRFTITADDFRKEMSSRKKINKTNCELEKKGFKVKGDISEGYWVVQILKTKTKYYDQTGEVKVGKNKKTYKLFKTLKDAIEFASEIASKHK